MSERRPCGCYRRPTGLNALSITGTVILGMTLCFNFFESFLEQFAYLYDYKKPLEIKCIALAAFGIGTLSCIILGIAASMVSAWLILPALLTLPFVLAFCLYDLTMRCLETDILSDATADILAVFNIADRGIMVPLLLLNTLLVPFAIVLALKYFVDIQKACAATKNIRKREFNDSDYDMESNDVIMSPSKGGYKSHRRSMKKRRRPRHYRRRVYLPMEDYPSGRTLSKNHHHYRFVPA